MKTLLLIFLIQVQPQDSVLVPLKNIREANLMITELYYLRSKESLCNVSSKLLIQQLGVSEQKERACINLVQTYKEETVPKKRGRAILPFTLGFILSLIIK